jgi:2-polyprenyl-3-methyl-5-hydroxy-6-metoxy-1,4-benzoquinol methylase
MSEPEMFSRAWYSEYFRRADASEAHAEFCRRVYGANLCQHGMMDMEELDQLVARIPHGKRIVEIGCGTGRISEYIHARVSPTFMLASDYADAAIDQAQRRTADRAATLQFRCLDLSVEEVPDAPYDVAILIDSIYFLGDYARSIERFCKLMRPGATMLLAAFEEEKPGAPADILQPARTRVAKALAQLGLAYEQHDYTHKMHEHWQKNYRVSRELERAFTDEGNRFLFEARVAENVDFKEKSDRKALARFLYVIRP